MLVLLTGLMLFSGLTKAEQVRDLASFAGVRDNPLVGYGLVVGLDGTGDQTMQAPFTGQSLNNMLSQLGITVPPGTNMQLRNIAAVMVTADLPPFATPGQRLDIVVSSVGNARSLRGGTLLMTPLKGADGDVYALAQGNLLINGASAQSAGSSAQTGHQASGRIAGGATVEQSVPLSLGDQYGGLELHLKQADFGTAERVVSAINADFGYPVASARNGGVILLNGPTNANSRVNFMAQVESVDVSPVQPPARVVLNSRTGSIVLNGAVTLSRAAVAHGNLSVVIDTSLGVSQPAPFSKGRTRVVPKSDISINEETGTLRVVEGANLLDVVDALNALGATPNDLMAILEALKAAGSLHAELEII
ncbi:flagellar basal body P-ring protein FlgI [Halomonas binhaiensis]|uniref:Flagellar P-ring protein n=2 Tax=Halomonas binhaiensis TaxID=2562282 RepID=A0A856QVC1_9GAMM|nr:flagellar basal body P-ring protein FlgI [Halomonas binhaiensis]QEM83817.2 flagellar basal body P-ring protein FlgI [Halomonas binhaiensis]